MKTTIVIPTRSRAGSLQRVLGALGEQRGAKFEVVVITDGRCADTRALSQQFQAGYPLRWVWRTVSGGPCGTRRFRQEDIQGGLLLFLDDDTIPAPDWIAGHCAHHERERGDVVVVGRSTNQYDFPPRSRREALLRRLNSEWYERYWREIGSGSRSDYSAGLNTSMSPDLYFRFGGPDPQLTLQSDDELGYRMRQAGIRFVHDPSLLVYHHEVKDLVADFSRRAATFAKIELYRARDKGQIDAVRDQLGSIFFGSRWYWRWKDRAAWHFPRLVRSIANCAGAVGERLNWGKALKAWSVLTFASRYWGTLRRAGVTLSELHRLVSSPSVFYLRRETELEPGATAVVCTRDHADALRRIVASLRAEGVRHVLVIDNGSGSNTAARVGEEVGVRCVREPVAGLTRARNRALAEITTELIAFVDDDCRACVGWLKELTAPFSDPDIAAVAGRAVCPETSNVAQRHFDEFGHGFEDHPRTVSREQMAGVIDRAAIGIGANMAFRTVALRQVGGFPHYRLTSADDDYIFFVLADAGYRLAYTPASVVERDHRSSFWSQLRRLARYSFDHALVTWHLASVRRSTRFFVRNALKFGVWSSLRRVLGAIKRGRVYHVVYACADLLGSVAGLFAPSGWLMAMRAMRHAAPEARSGA